jgi:hypothetical protein
MEDPKLELEVVLGPPALEDGRLDDDDGWFRPNFGKFI